MISTYECTNIRLKIWTIETTSRWFVLLWWRFISNQPQAWITHERCTNLQYILRNDNPYDLNSEFSLLQNRFPNNAREPILANKFTYSIYIYIYIYNRITLTNTGFILGITPWSFWAREFFEQTGLVRYLSTLRFYAPHHKLCKEKKEKKIKSVIINKTTPYCNKILLRLSFINFLQYTILSKTDRY